MTLEPLDVLNLASAAFLTTLGVFLLVRKGRNATTSALAVLAIGLAGLYVARFAAKGSINPVPYVVITAFTTAATAGFVVLAWLVPTRLDAWQARVALASATLASLAYAIGDGVTYDWSLVYPDALEPSVRTPMIWVHAILGSFYVFAAFLLAYRGTRPEAEPTAIRSLAILAIGMALFGAGTAQSWTDRAAEDSANAIVSLLMVIIMGLAWFRFGDSPSRRFVRRVSLAILGVWTAATFAALVAPEYTYPFGRILGTLLLVYAVLRGQIAGIDAKARFTLSKSAVAAVFVGVFFAGSELAQQFFGDQTGNEYYGIAAAGLLVVAIAPIQRLADRLATQAIPVQGGNGDRTAQEEIYHEAVQAASRDGIITRREEMHLARIADRLGISAERALQLRDPDMDDVAHPP